MRLPRIVTSSGQALSQVVTLGFHGMSNPLEFGAQIHACNVHTLAPGAPYGARLVKLNSCTAPP
jgi:hypothetical protein